MGLRYCGIELFSSGISVILILMCVIAVSSSRAVCGFSSFWLTVFGRRRSLTALRYSLPRRRSKGFVARGAGTRDEPLRTSAWEANCGTVHLASPV